MKIDWINLWDVTKGVFLLLAGGFVTRLFERRAKLISYFGHISAFVHTPPQGNPIHVFSHSVILRNTGGIPVTNVRINHKNLPDFNIWPSVAYNVETLPNGSKDIVIPRMIPKEQLTINYLYFPPLTATDTNSGIKSDQGFAQQIAVLHQPKPAKWIMVIVWALIAIGMMTLLYFVKLGFDFLSSHS